MLLIGVAMGAGTGGGMGAAAAVGGQLEEAEDMKRGERERGEVR